jgi:hypothetical protein
MVVVVAVGVGVGFGVTVVLAAAVVLAAPVVAGVDVLAVWLRHEASSSADATAKVSSFFIALCLSDDQAR